METYPASDMSGAEDENSSHEDELVEISPTTLPAITRGMHELLNVDGNDDPKQTEEVTKKSSSVSATRRGHSGRSRQPATPRFRVEVAMPATTPPTTQQPPAKAAPSTSYAQAAQVATDEDSHVLIVTTRGDDIRAALPDPVYKELELAINKEITKMAISGDPDTPIPAVNWLAKNGAVTKISCCDIDTVQWVKAYVQRWDETRAQVLKSKPLEIRAWTKIEMPEHDICKIVMPLPVYEAVGKASIIRSMIRQNRLAGKAWMMSDIDSGNHRVLVLGVDDDMAVALKARGLQVFIGARRFTLTYQTKRQVSETPME